MSTSDPRENGYQGETEDDYGFECENCGKPMSFRFCSMCWRCEQEYNDIGLEEGIFRAIEGAFEEDDDE